MDSLYRNKLGSVLISAGLITEDEIAAALEEQRKSGRRLGEGLIGSGKISEEDIVEARALQLDIPHIHLRNYVADPEVVKMVPENLARLYKLAPISASESRVAVAMADPLDVEALDMVQRTTRCKVDALLASDSSILELLRSIYGEVRSGDLSAAVEEAVGAAEDVEFCDTSGDDEEDLSETRRASEQAPIVRTVNHFLKQAVEARASDVHLEPHKRGCDVRFRIDGVLQHIRTLPKSIQAPVLSRVKIMSDLDIAEKRLPQDGRISVSISGRQVDMRVSTLPTKYGERIVVRLLDAGNTGITMEQLGFSQQDRDILDQMVTKPYGLILVTGPTGSGKSTTLYSFLSRIRSPELNLLTVEDPIEYDLEGVCQSAVNVRAGLTFAAQLRAILRQDPDVVLVGEIRDQETADIAFRASMTGHLVLSTLHCNDASSAFARLTDMGVEPFLISSSTSGVIAQRLVRTICPSCRQTYSPEAEEALTLEQLGVDPAGAKLSRGGGCKSCANTGYKGRMLIAEVLTMTTQIRDLALGRAPSGQIKQMALSQGMMSMRDDAMAKVFAGQTTLAEISRKVLMTEE